MTTNLADAARILDLELDLCRLQQRSEIKTQVIEAQRDALRILRERLEQAGLETNVEIGLLERICA